MPCIIDADIWERVFSPTHLIVTSYSKEDRGCWAVFNPLPRDFYLVQIVEPLLGVIVVGISSESKTLRGICCMMVRVGECDSIEFFHIYRHYLSRLLSDKVALKLNYYNLFVYLHSMLHMGEIVGIENNSSIS